MIDFPDLPDCLRIPQAERKAAWKGARLKPIASFKLEEPKKPTDPSTIVLLQERAAAEHAAAKAAKQARKEAAIIKQRRRAKPKDQASS